MIWVCDYTGVNGLRGKDMIDFSADEITYVNNAVATHLNDVHDELGMIQLAALECPALAIDRYQDIQQILLDIETGSDIILKLVPKMSPGKETEEIRKITTQNRNEAIKMRQSIEAKASKQNHAGLN